MAAVTAAMLLALAATGFAAPAGPAGNELKELQDLRRPANGNGFAPTPSISLQQATSIARGKVGGRVLSANPRRSGGAIEYRVRMLVDGERVVTVTVDGSGKVRRNH